jgi:pimeloyl-ACP methyl ester carboxylesterase
VRQLVLVHGRSPHRKDAAALRSEWLDALHSGLAAAGLTLPIPESEVRFPYYGDALTNGATGPLSEIIAGESDVERAAFLRAVFLEVARERGIGDADIAAEAGPGVAEPDQDWFRALLRLLDRSTLAGSASIALFVDDVHRYLTDVGVRDAIDSEVRAAVTPGVETVVVGHSLGSVVTYRLLCREGIGLGWRVPLHVTVGSPLGVGAIRAHLAPIGHPTCATRWFNATDQRDAVALHPLDATHFAVEPAIENKTDVYNTTPDGHGIRGYLTDPDVACRIHRALTG